MNNYQSAFIILFGVLVFAGCEDEKSEDENKNLPPVETEEGSWTIYSPIKWSHDGAPVTGTYCKGFSDGASLDLKLQCLDFADDIFGEVTTRFNVENTSDP